MMAEEQQEQQQQQRNHKQQQHATQWERQSEWLERLRNHKKELLSQGIQSWDLMEAMATLSLNHKISISQHRCSTCWHDQTNCLCSQLEPLMMAMTRETTTRVTTTRSSMIFPNIKILILMHHKEHLCAGNSAKLLLQLLPDHTELYLFGKVGEVDRLFQEINVVDRSHTMILWPDKDALSVSDFLLSAAAHLREQPQQQNQTQEQNHRGDFPIRRRMEEPKSSSSAAEPSSSPQPTTIRAIVLDGTYTQARNMHHSLQKRWGSSELPMFVQLRPTNSSIFHRAQKNYGKAHRQQQEQQEQHEQQQSKTTPLLAERISTAEACGLLLTELGANEQVQEMIIQAVLINNEALAFARGGRRRAKVYNNTEEDGGNG